MKSSITGRKFYFIAIFITAILFLTVHKGQHGGWHALIKHTVAHSTGVILVADHPPARAHLRLASVYNHQANRPQVVVPVTGAYTTASPIPVATQISTPQPSLPSLQSFIVRVINGQADALVGIYVKDIMALRVVQQPNSDPAYIDLDEGTATQFSTASSFGATGLLAHNFLSGRYFFDLTLGDDLVLVYGNGQTSHYTVSEIGDYQRLSPADLRSDFLDLATNQQKSVDDVFTHYYQQEQVLTLQTCIAQDGNSDWGVRFILARPYPLSINRIEIASRFRR